MDKLIKKILFLTSYILSAIFLFTMINNIANDNIYLYIFYTLIYFIIILAHLRYSGINVGKVLGVFIYDAWELKTKKEHNKFTKLKEEINKDKPQESLFTFIIEIIPGFFIQLSSFIVAFISIKYAIENPLSLYNLGLLSTLYTIYIIIKAFYFFILFPNKGIKKNLD